MPEMKRLIGVRQDLGEAQHAKRDNANYKVGLPGYHLPQLEIS